MEILILVSEFVKTSDLPSYQLNTFFPLCVIFAVPLRNAPIQGQPLPPDYGPPPYEATNPGFLPPHVPGDGPMPMPMPMPLPQGAADILRHTKTS